MKIEEPTAATLRPWFPSLRLEDVRLVQRGPVSWFVRHVLHQGAMTIAPYVFFGLKPFDPADMASVALLAHELQHVEQYRRLGHVRFLSRYLRDLARNHFHYSRLLPLEAECYELQADVRRALDRPGRGVPT